MGERWKETCRLEVEQDLPALEVDREGVGVACLLKGQDRPLHSHLFFVLKRWEVRHNRLKELGWQILRTAFCIILEGNLRKLGADHMLG